MRVLVGHFSHETNTFSNVYTGLPQFSASRKVTVGEEMRQAFAGTNTGVGGYIAAAGELGLELVFTVGASAAPSGLVLKSAYDHFSGQILAGLEGGPFDGVLLALHGAMCAQGAEDLDGEGTLIKRLRERVGPDVPIVVTLDLHTLLTDRMLEHADLIIWYKTYPHVDMADRAVEAARLLARLIRREIKPALGVRRLPLLAPITRMRTGRQPMQGIVERMVEIEREPGVLTASFVHGFPYADVPYNCAAAVVYTDGHHALAQRHADELADRLWSQRALLAYRAAPIPDVIDRALREPSGLIVIPDVSDNPGGGGTGDSVEVLRELLRRQVDRAAFGGLWDPGAVGLLHNAGEGTEITLRLGGKVDAFHGQPLDVTGVVERLHDGTFEYKGPMSRGARGTMGPCAVLRIPTENGRVRVLVHEYRFQVVDPEMFRCVGIEPTAERIVVLKSSVHFRAAFEPIAAQVIEVDGPGLVPQDVASLPWRHVPRPIFPLDPL